MKIDTYGMVEIVEGSGSPCNDQMEPVGKDFDGVKYILLSDARQAALGLLPIPRDFACNNITISNEAIKCLELDMNEIYGEDNDKGTMH